MSYTDRQYKSQQRTNVGAMRNAFDTHGSKSVSAAEGDYDDADKYYAQSSLSYRSLSGARDTSVGLLARAPPMLQPPKCARPTMGLRSASPLIIGWGHGYAIRAAPATCSTTALRVVWRGKACGECEIMASKAV